MAWIESHQELGRHPKTRKLARALNISRPAVIGHLHYLWWWSLDFAQDGDLSRYDADELAEAALWDGEPAVFIEALMEAGFIERATSHLHDWDEYAGKLLDQRRANARRQADFRNRHKPATDADADVTHNADEASRNGYITVTSQSRNAATVPNLTEPNQTEDTPTVSDAQPLAEVVGTPPMDDSAPTARSSNIITLPDRMPSETTERAYWERVMKDLPSAQRIPTLVHLARDKIGADDAPGGATYARLGALARKHTASLVAVWIIQASGQHIAGDPLDYLTKLATGQLEREARNNGRPTAYRSAAGGRHQGGQAAGGSRGAESVTVAAERAKAQLLARRVHG